MRCERCANENPAFFYYDKGVYYCRKCIQFGRLNVGEGLRKAKTETRKINAVPQMSYELTARQKEASQKALSYLLEGKNVFVWAAAGAGKTEMSYASICSYLERGKKVGFAISRRQVVLEIADRLAQTFPMLKVIAVCEGHTKELDGDIIVCTTHQLYRYPDTFDLLILDELDAFPYAGNQVLKTIASRACKGQKLLLSATPDEDFMKDVKSGKMMMVTLFQRPHKHPLPVPKVIQLPFFLQIIACLIVCRHLVKQNKQILVYVPRKADGKKLLPVFNKFFSCHFIHSSSKDKDEVLDSFRKKELNLLLTTTLLERGITIPNVQVAVLEAEHTVFTTASLIQIYGRVGRSFNEPEGIGLCFCQEKSDAIKECLRQIKKMNRDAFGV